MAEKNGAMRDGQAEVEERGARDNTPDAECRKEMFLSRGGKDGKQ
jgi:hypothetical protein